MHFSSIISFLSLVCLSLQATYTNPLKNPNGSDPFIVTTGGYYYLMTTTWTNIEVTRATTLNGLKTGEKKVVYSTSTASRCCNVWAPEVHYINGIWYVYYTAGNSANLDGQRVHVLTGGATPWDAFSYTRQVTSDWGIDATVFRTTSANYLVWSCISGVQSLCIATLNTPTTIGAINVLSKPTLSWETVGNPVNEGPAALYAGGKSYLTYSASDCWTASYQLGLLTWDGTTSPLLAAAWKKSGPVMSSANGNYGTGHNGFFTSFDGKEIWNVYHATANSAGAVSIFRNYFEKYLLTEFSVMEIGTRWRKRWHSIVTELQSGLKLRPL